MHELEKTLERWNENIMKQKQELEELPGEEEENEDNIENEINVDEKEKEEIKEIDDKKYGTMIGIGGLQSLLKSKNKSEKITKIGGDKEKKPSLKLALSKSTIQKDVNTLTNPNERPLTEDEVLDIIKGWILTGFLTKLYIKLHKYMANYDSIPDKDKYIYEHDIIKGNSDVKSPIEILIWRELISVDLSDLTMSEMNELKQYFDGTRKKKLEELKKKRRKLAKMKKSVNKVMTVNKLTKSKEKTEEEKLNIEKEKEKIRQ
jgi:hypothetical protein